VYASLPTIKAALSRWLSELHAAHTSFPLEKPGDDPWLLYSLEYVRPGEDEPPPPADELLEHMEIELFDVHRPTDREAPSSAAASRVAASTPGTADANSDSLAASLIDREISRVRIVATFSAGAHGEGEDASAFPGVVARGRRHWCPSVLISGRRFQFEGKIRVWWQMQTGLLRMALLDVPQLDWSGGAGVHVLGCDGVSRLWRLPRFVAFQLGNRLIERALYENFGMHNPITIPVKLWTPRGSLGYLVAAPLAEAPANAPPDFIVPLPETVQEASSSAGHQDESTGRRVATHLKTHLNLW